MNDQNRLKLSLNVAVASAIFTIIVALLLLLNFLQVSRQDPLESKAVETLVQRLSENPDDDALKNDIRNLDLLARKAYFNSRWQVKTGSHLLLFGAVLFAVAMRIYYSLKSGIEIPDQKAEDELKARILSQKWILFSGAAFLVLALAASYLTVDHLKSFDLTQVSGDQQVAATSPDIEVIEVGKVPVSVSPDSTGMKDTSLVAPLFPEVKDSVKNTGMAASPDASQIKANYPSFRGPFGNGVSAFKNVPVDFDGPSKRNVLWKAYVMLPGNNSPVIWGDKLFLSGASARIREIYCYNRHGGMLLWTATVDSIQGSPANDPKVTEDTGFAAPSLATDGTTVFGIFANGDVIAIDMMGKRVWARNLGMPDNHYGHSSSLILWKTKLYIQYDTNKSRKLIALDTGTGETVWETTRNVKISWASPILANVGGKYQVILSADPLVAGYDAETGKELWSVSCMLGEVGPSPAFGEGLVYAANEYAKLVAINPANGQVVWEADEYLPEVASPVVSGGLLFVATTYGILACYDAKTGEKLWENDCGTGYYSSPVITDGKLFAFDQEGHLQVYALTREKSLLSESSLGVKVYTTPAFANGRMFVRAGGVLYCIGTE